MAGAGSVRRGRRGTQGSEAAGQAAVDRKAAASPCTNKQSEAERRATADQAAAPGAAAAAPSLAANPASTAADTSAARQAGY